MAQWFLHQPWWLGGLAAGGSFWNTQADLDHSVHPFRRPWGPAGARPMPAERAADGQAWRGQGLYGCKVPESKREAVVQRQTDN